MNQAELAIIARIIEVKAKYRVTFTAHHKGDKIESQTVLAKDEHDAREIFDCAGDYRVLEIEALTEKEQVTA